MKILIWFIITVVVVTGCQMNTVKETDTLSLPNAEEGVFCEVYTPEGKVLYDAEWGGELPKVEAFNGDYKTVTFGMGCFWGPAAEFAVLDGVLRTRVGYAGGDLATPNYEVLGNHIEVFEVDYDPEVITYEDLIKYYFAAYDSTQRPFSRRVHSVIYYRGEEEKAIAEKVKSDLESDLGQGLFTEIDGYESFYLAEERHQLSYLKKETSLYGEISQIYPEHDQQILSILASRLNGHIAGFGSEESLEKLLSESSLSEASQNRMRVIVDR